MASIRKIWKFAKAFIPSLIFNFKYLPFAQARKLPIMCSKEKFLETILEGFPTSNPNRINTLHKLVHDDARILITGQSQTAIGIDCDVWTNYQYVRLY